ncbi:MAG: DJ-1/PfpI family protein [Chloroflexota bacterium]
MPPRVFDWHDDPTGAFLAAPQIRARFTRYEPGQGYRNYHTHQDAGPIGARETWVVLEGAVAFDFDGTEVIVRRGQAVTAAPHEKHRDRCASDEPAIAFLCVTPHVPPTHTHYYDDGTRRPARAGVSTPTWMGEPPLGHEQSAPIFAAWEAANAAGAAPAGASGSGLQVRGAATGQASGQANGQTQGTTVDTLSAHQGRHFSSADRFTEAERNGTPVPAQPKGKVLLAIGDAAEATDTLYPWMRLMEAGYECVVAAPEVRTYQLVLHERPEGWHITRETPGYRFDADIAFKDIEPAAYAGILISGGRAPEYIRYDQALNTTVRWMVEHGRPVGSVCHGIEVLATADVIRGKRVTCVPKCQFDAEVCGATYVAAPVVVDGRLVTARGARDGWLWMREFLKVLDQVEGAAAGAGQTAGAAGTSWAGPIASMP